MKLFCRHITPAKLQRALLLVSFLGSASLTCHSHAQGNYDPFNPSAPTRKGTNAEEVMNRANASQSDRTISQQEKRKEVEELTREVIKAQPAPKTVVKTTPTVQTTAPATPRPRPVLYDFPTRINEPGAAGYQTAFSRML